MNNNYDDWEIENKEYLDGMEEKRQNNISKGRDFDYTKFTTDDGVKTFSPKPQYVRGGTLFNCPFCELKCSSHSYLWYSAFEDSIKEHIGKEHTNIKDNMGNK